ncbi:hypothetical protein SLS61_009905 [Didymella pomorum]
MRYITLTHLSSLAFTAGASICPMLGPVFPIPKGLHSSVIFQDKLKDIQTKMEEAFASGNTTHGPVDPSDTYSIQVFSTSSEDLLIDYHRRGPAVLGNRTIDGDSVYRIASTSKLIAVYLLLIQAGPSVFSDKVVKYLPELAGAAHWNDITVGSLAGYLADIAAELFDSTSLPGGDISALFPGVFPSLGANETIRCKYGTSECNREVFIENLINRQPAYLPNTTPAYSNAAFATLGLVLEAVAKSTFKDVLRDQLLTPLNLNGTSMSPPEDLAKAVIPGNATVSGWDVDLSYTLGAAMGGLFSSPNDLSAIGRAMLTSTLLPSSTTRAWMKPTSFTSSLLGATGHGWEIFRAVTNAKHNRIVDLYTKGGNLPGYGANMILIPDFEVGITILNAGSRGTVGAAIAGLILDDLLPALDEAARAQADAAFAGTYSATNGLNSTVKLTTEPGVPGLRIEAWTINGTDIRNSPFLTTVEDYQMFPTNILSDDGKQLSWRSTDLSLPETGSPFDACPSWFGVDRPNYGVYGFDEWVFHMDEHGKAWGLEPKALKIVLEKD